MTFGLSQANRVCLCAEASPSASPFPRSLPLSSRNSAVQVKDQIEKRSLRLKNTYYMKRRRTDDLTPEARQNTRVLRPYKKEKALQPAAFSHPLG